MDSFKQIWGAPEGCSSSESGWTMYIDSPMQEDDARCSNENDGYNHNHNHNHNHHEVYGEKNRRKKKVDEEESDDSMASDASSGPTNYQQHRGAQGRIGTSVSKKDKQDHGSKSFSKKNGSKQEKKRVDSRSKK